jgi:redox-sensitive bicupin YhaK (pirin superfamily)
MKRMHTSLRRIAHRARGVPKGPVTRVIDVTQLGELVKPFVLLDYFDLAPKGTQGFGIHPHSGIETLALLLDGNISYEDTAGKSGVLTAGSHEWMRAGAGVWHAGRAVDCQRLRGLQLWVALPPELEEGPPESQYISPPEVQTDGPARIAIGRHGKASSAVRPPESLNYLNVRLKDGERWLYEPPEGHEVAWVFPYVGQLNAPAPVLSGELVVFEESTAPLEFGAVGDTELVLGSAVKHSHDLVLGYYSVHTSPQALTRSAAQIARIGEGLRTVGKIDDVRLRQTVERVRVGNW